MNKKGARILLGCILCTLIICVLFIVAFRFTQPSCELIFIEPAQLRSAALSSWAKEKPVRSNEESIILKISAYLEYSVPTNPSAPIPQAAQRSTEPATTTTVLQQPQQHHQQLQPPPVTQQQTQSTISSSAASPAQFQQQPPAQSIISTNQQTGTQSQSSGTINSADKQVPHPSIPQTGFTNQQLQNSSFNPVVANNKDKEKRFVLLELHKIRMKKVDDNRYKYTLSFNCSTMTMIFVRRPERVHVEHISMELTPANRHKSSCELQLPNQGVFGVDIHAHQPVEGLAHYYCSRPLRYSCYHYSSKHPNQAGLLLAELHINGIEFETGSNSSNFVHSSHKFFSPKKECELPPGGVSA